MKKTTLSYITLLLLIVAGCEVSLHDNFVDIEQPDEIPIGINLNTITEGENIIIYKEKTIIHYTFETAGREVQKVEFTLGDRQWETRGESGEIWFTPDRTPNGNYTLTCTLYVYTNTGSMADQVKLEAYGRTMSWKVTVAYENGPTEVPEITTRINEEGYLELTWEKPYYKYMNFLNYTVRKSGSLLATIEDVGITSFIDKSHVLDGGQQYDIQANFEENVSWHIGYKNMPYSKIIIEQVEDISAIDSCTVKWENEKGYKCKWNVYVNDELKLMETEETSIRIPVCTFGTFQYNLHQIRVEVFAYDASDRKGYSHYEYGTAGTMGKFLSDNYMRFDYNESENTLYYSVRGEVNSLSVPDLSPIAKHNGTGSYYDTYAINSSEKSSKILVSYSDVLALYEGKMLPTPLTYSIPYLIGGEGPQILNDDRIFYFDRTHSEDMVACILSADMKPQKRVILQGVPYSYFGIISADGKYICTSNTEEIVIYKMSPEFDVLEKNAYSIDEVTHNYIRFMPHDSSQILVGRATMNMGETETITIYNTEGMTPVHSYEAQFANIDPKTGYLCLSKRDQIEIIDINSGETLFTLPNELYHWVHLLGGILISERGYALNINPYLN
ncbi:hypothetical protein [Bacteroides sp. UBA939]|uniref:hypothetical protein n=1 Tax=Bacteroides sp. UBA939 TaxID=1946092 RepID=UPI0025C221DC|nr:hypothetical protein [Bacteroides sp. UBA939]